MPKSKSGSAKAQPLAIELLEADHRKVEDLFERYDGEKESDDQTRRAVAGQICNELKAHAQLEEELFYPWLRENLEEDEMEMLEEAEVEHAGAKDLIAQIEAATEVDAHFDAMVKVLSEYIKHHVKEEEEEIFSTVRAEKEELDELGQEMAARKVEIAEEIGLEDEDAPDAGRSGKSGGASATRNSR